MLRPRSRVNLHKRGPDPSQERPRVFQSAINLSEGRNSLLLEQIQSLMERQPGVALADLSMDPDHHRMVVSLLGRAQPLRQAILRLFELATQHIDLSQHQGVHPRIGAVDVIPFVALGSTPGEAALELAEACGQDLARRFELPILFYEESARRPENRQLPDLRRGGLEGLARRLQEIPPDLGPATLHPRWGACILGARRPLVAFNLVLDTQDLAQAQAIARRLRALVGVRALGLSLASRHQVQVSVNLTQPDQVDLLEIFQAVEELAREQGLSIESSELIGLAPAQSFLKLARHHLKMTQLKPGQLLEWNFLHQARSLETPDETR